MGVLSGITYHEEDGSNVLSFRPEEVVGRRIFQVDWSDRIEFCRILLGYTRAVGHVPIRTDAQTFPDYDYLYCQTADIEPIGTWTEVGGVASYERARIRAEYRPLRWGSSVTEDDDEFDEELEESMASFEQVMEYGGEFISIPGSQFEYSGDPGVSVDHPLGILVGVIDVTLSSSSEPELRNAAIMACLGKVNSALWCSCLPECLLFFGASARRTINSEGTPGWQVTYRFRERAQSWNKVLRVVAGAVTWPELNPKPYETADFSILFA